MNEKRCHERHVTLFFSPSKVDEDLAKRICARCPVREICLKKALLLNPRDGVWAGMNTRERDVYRRELRRKDAR